jgi:hypothetical protein
MHHHRPARVDPSILTVVALPVAPLFPSTCPHCRLSSEQHPEALHWLNNDTFAITSNDSIARSALLPAWEFRRCVVSPLSLPSHSPEVGGSEFGEKKVLSGLELEGGQSSMKTTPMHVVKCRRRTTLTDGGKQRC